VKWALKAWEPADYSIGHTLTEAFPPPYAEFLRLAVQQALGLPSSPLDKFRDLARSRDLEESDDVPPGSFAINRAQHVLDRCAHAELQSDRIVAIPDGGLAIYFFGTDLTTTGAHRLVARLAIDNDGATTLLLEDVEEHRSNVTDEEIANDRSIDDVLGRVKAHISR
jgi:hypothetical protein